ncbi:MAG: type I-C CRISPR-associated protein Cas8c/Csd1 [Actinobacteria bacterium]|nr:type I-C CRISPR-associated protein Cas8c/Csd1 [Actinomycetota bacterium]
MSWIHRLYETYNNCYSMIGVIENEKKVPLLPICHTTQIANIEVIIDQNGNFKRAKVVSRYDATTIIPCTETSSGRTGKKPVCHPLCDKLQYVAGDFAKCGGKVTIGYKDNPEEPFKDYINLLTNWNKSKFSHPKVGAILSYAKKGNVIEDLVKYKIILVDNEGKLLEKSEKKTNNIPEIFKVLNSQSEAFIRWEVEISNDPCSKVWEDKTLWDSWIKFYSSTKQSKTLCYVTGEELYATDQHPAKLRDSGDKAKIISFNDFSGFTFRGRFTKADQACGVGFEVTQKAHNALRWLISRQGYKSKGKSRGQAIVAWAISGVNIPDPLADPLSILGTKELSSNETIGNYTAQDLAIKLKQKIAGYSIDLGPTDNIVVMGINSASPGRMSIIFYRELTGSDFLERLNKWHESCCWIHDYGYDKETKKYYRFVGAPAPEDIAEAAYGNKVDDKLRQTTVGRILPCIIDDQYIPKDIVESTTHRACNRTGIKDSEWNKTLSIACALYKKFKEKENIDMSLDNDRKTRDYLFGRLLATADRLEDYALSVAKEKRDTNAARLMQRFATNPCSTWMNIELALIPYKARLGGRAQKYKEVIDEIMNKFETVEDFNNDKPLSGEFLLGYHCQREYLKPSGIKKEGEKENN